MAVTGNADVAKGDEGDGLLPSHKDAADRKLPPGGQSAPRRPVQPKLSDLPPPAKGSGHDLHHALATAAILSS
jgi:hypothetical protein